MASFPEGTKFKKPKGLRQPSDLVFRKPPTLEKPKPVGRIPGRKGVAPGGPPPKRGAALEQAMRHRIASGSQGNSAKQAVKEVWNKEFSGLAQNARRQVKAKARKNPRTMNRERVRIAREKLKTLAKE